MTDPAVAYHVDTLLNIALDDLYLDHLARRSDLSAAVTIRTWHNNPAIVLGRSLNLTEEVSSLALDSLQKRRLPERFNLEADRSVISVTDGEHHLPVIRRSSGGGTVVHGPGIINYSIFINLNHYTTLYGVKDSYVFLLELTGQALMKAAGLDQKPFCRGMSDLAVNIDGADRKIAGQAQFRRLGWLCHHGSVLGNLDWFATVQHLMTLPPRVPEYRRNRPHSEFVTACGLEDAEGFRSELVKQMQSSLKNAGQVIAVDIQAERQWLNDFANAPVDKPAELAEGLSFNHEDSSAFENLLSKKYTNPVWHRLL